MMDEDTRRGDFGRGVDADHEAGNAANDGGALLAVRCALAEEARFLDNRSRVVCEDSGLASQC